MKESQKNILMTGCTGFLGGYILQALLDNTDARIFAPIRVQPHQTKEDCLRRISDNMQNKKIWNDKYAERINAFPSDISKQYLGLDKEQFDSLAKDLDCIIHGAAWVNFINSYDMLKSANVDGTVHLLELACRFKAIPFSYVSTLAVFFTLFDPVKKAFESDPAKQSKGLFSGYVQTKYVSEQIVRLAEKQGLPTQIIRPARILGDSHLGTSPENDLSALFLVAILQTLRAPDLNIWIDLAPVDFYSNAIAALSIDNDAYHKTYHLLNPDRIHLKEIVEWFIEFGYEIKTVPYSEWIECNKEQDSVIIPLLTAFNQNYISREGTNFFQAFTSLESVSRDFYDCTLAKEALEKKSLFQFPSPKELLKKYIYSMAQAIPYLNLAD